MFRCVGRTIGGMPTPIGNRRPEHTRRKPLRPENTRPMGAGTVTSGPTEIVPVNVRYNSGPRNGKVDRFSRMIITEDWLYIATSQNKGRDVEKVTRYPHPAGDRKQGPSKSGSWGSFSWSGCSCGNSWGMHSRAKLIKMGDDAAAAAGN